MIKFANGFAIAPDGTGWKCGKLKMYDSTMAWTQLTYHSTLQHAVSRVLDDRLKELAEDENATLERLLEEVRIFRGELAQAFTIKVTT